MPETTIDDPVRRHLSDAGRKGAEARWGSASPAQRTAGTAKARRARASAAARLDAVEAELAELKAKFAAALDSAAA
jgi:hypothetical protein